MAGAEMSWQAYLQAALEYDQDFVLKMAAYLYLKSKNWIIKSGIKFGGDFRKVLEGISANLFYLSFDFLVIYKQGPSQFHASFLVIVQVPKQEPDSHYVAKNLKGVQRVAETSDKDVLILVVQQPADFNAALATPESLESLTIDETVIRRFNYTSFVQSKQKQ